MMGRAPQSGQVGINAESSPVDEWHQFEPAPNWRRLSIELQTLFEHPLIEEAAATAQLSPSLSIPKRDFLSLSAPIKQDFHLLTFVSGEYYAHCLFWHQG